MSKMHYVPQRYLENFSNKNKQIYAFAKDTQKQFLPNVSGVATEGNFYGSQEMEEWFWKPEGKQITSISNLQNKVEEVLELPENEIYEASLLSSEYKANLSEVLAIQFLRTKSLRNLYGEIRQKIKAFNKPLLETNVYTMLDNLQAEMGIEIDESMKSDLANYASHQYDLATKVGGDNEPSLHNDLILNRYEELAQNFRSFIWMLGINVTDIPIYTSDHPIVKFAHSSSNGLFSEGVEIVFPIDRKLVLIMLEPNYFQNFAHRDCKLMQLSSNKIIQFNTLQVTESFRFIFCSQDSFDLAEQLCKDHPELCILDRDRIEITINYKVETEGFGDEK